MNQINIVKEGFSKIFFGEDAIIKHIILFMLTGIISIISVYFSITSETIKATKVLPDFAKVMLAVVILAVVGIYLSGYNFKLVHNAFDSNKKDILPNFGADSFNVFWKILPLMIYWTACIIIALILSSSLLVVPGIRFIGLFLFIFILFLCAFIQFIYIAYTENFDKAGLFNIMLPIKFVKPSIGSLCLFGIIFIPIYILSMFPSFVAGIILGFIGVKDTNMIMYIGGILGGYFSFVIQMVWYYCLVQIFKEKIKPIM